MTGRRNHEKTLAVQERPCSVLTEPDRPWDPEKRRDGYNIGRCAKQRCWLRGTNARQNGAAEYAEQCGSLSGITSTPAVWWPATSQSYQSFNPAGSGNRTNSLITVAYLMSRPW